MARRFNHELAVIVHKDWEGEFVVAVHANSYAYRFKSWEKVPLWARERVHVLRAAMEHGYAHIPEFGIITGGVAGKYNVNLILGRGITYATSDGSQAV